jgi:hypothetical protein
MAAQPRDVVNRDDGRNRRREALLHSVARPGAPRSFGIGPCLPPQKVLGI